MGYQENEKGEVVITMARADWESLLLTLGYAIGAASRIDGSARGHLQVRAITALVNRLNEGNPWFTQYVLDEDPPPDASST